MPSGEGRGRTSAMEKKRLIGRDLDHCMVPKIEIYEFIGYSHSVLPSKSHIHCAVVLELNVCFAF